MSTLKDLISQKEAIDMQIHNMTEHARSEAISKILALMKESGVSFHDLGGRSASKTRAKKASAESTKVAAKYINSETGESWSGRGLQPKWVKQALTSGKSISDFAVHALAS